MAAVSQEPTARVTEIVAAARELLEAGGPDALTMRAVADKLGIRAPSLYKHIPDKADLEAAVIATAFTEQAETFAKAIARSRDPLTALGRAYRSWALAHPHLYRLMTNWPLDRDRLPEGVEASAAAPLLQACGGDPDRARAAWAFAHGMTSLELADRFAANADLDAAWRAGLGAFRTEG
jgi:AcrR family transcriptional regulator